MVYFENVDSATAAAQEVEILDTLDTNLDWNSFGYVGNTALYECVTRKKNNPVGIKKVTARIADVKKEHPR